jgi:hypothetical protein
MNSDTTKIASIALNNIKLDEMFQIDTSGGSDSQTAKEWMGSTAEKATGTNSPFVTINGYNITTYMSNFNLELSGILPVVRFSFNAGNPVFISNNYPKDGDIVSVYMRSPGDYYKPFRMDFKILNVYSDVSSKYSPEGEDSIGKYFKFSIVAECFIPGLYSPRIKSFPKLTSMDVLLEVSQNLNLGFSTNDKSTNDIMTWICPNYSYYDFIHEVVARSYKDDESSFFDVWIDSYYNLNFINMGSQFSYEGIIKDKVVYIPGYTNRGLNVDMNIPGASTPASVSANILLTNKGVPGESPFLINGYTLTSRAGSNSNSMGYITTIGFYDDVAEVDQPYSKYIQYDIESITSDNVKPGSMLQKGRVRSNDYKEETRKEWLGVLNRDSNGNGVHENFLHAKYQNLINQNDTTKMTLEVELENYFPGIIRGQIVPVEIYVFEGGNRQQNVGKIPNKEPNTGLSPTLDLFLSGNYIVIGITVYWDPSRGIKQKLILSKRTWDANISGATPRAFPISIINRKY